MKINQLFTKKVDTDVVLKLLQCFGINDLNEKKVFCKYDLMQNNTVSKLNALKPELERYYLPCKAKVYLEDLTEKRAITVLKQVLRLHGYYLNSKEKNLNNKKIIFYQMINEKDKLHPQNMKKYNITNILNFN